MQHTRWTQHVHMASNSSQPAVKACRVVHSWPSSILCWIVLHSWGGYLRCPTFADFAKVKGQSVLSPWSIRRRANSALWTWEGVPTGMSGNFLKVSSAASYTYTTSCRRMDRSNGFARWPISYCSASQFWNFAPNYWAVEHLVQTWALLIVQIVCNLTGSPTWQTAGTERASPCHLGASDEPLGDGLRCMLRWLHKTWLTSGTMYEVNHVYWRWVGNGADRGDQPVLHPCLELKAGVACGPWPAPGVHWQTEQNVSWGELRQWKTALLWTALYLDMHDVCLLQRAFAQAS